MLFLSGKRDEGRGIRKKNTSLSPHLFRLKKNTEISEAAKIRLHSIKDSWMYNCVLSSIGLGEQTIIVYAWSTHKRNI